MWWLALPANRRALFRQWVRQHRWHLALGVVAAVVIVSLFVLTHLDEAPVTGRTRLLVFSRENYIDLAALTSKMVRNERGGEKTNTQMCVTVQTKVFLSDKIILRQLRWHFADLILENEVVPFPSTSVLAGV